MNKANYYIDNKKFFNAVVDYKAELKECRDNGKEKPQMPNYLGDCFYRIANRYVFHSWFRGYPFHDDMISDAIFHCVKYIDTFDPTKTNNAFAYFTRTVHNAFRQRIDKEKKYLYTKYKAIENTEIFKHDENNGDIHYSESSKEKRSEFVNWFEKQKISKKKKKS